MENYTTEHVTFLSSDKTSTLSGIIYVPKEPPKGILQISHGMCEYIGRYHRFMADMANEGFIVCGHDHLGHGDSSSAEEYGYFAEKDGYRNLVEDLYRMTQLVKDKYGPLPYFLLGHSMGSFITRLYIRQYPDALDGVIICGTGGPNPMAKTGTALAKFMGSVKGSHHRSPMLDKMAFGSFNKKFTPCRTSKDWLTRDEKVVDKYLKDPKCMFTFTTYGFRDLTTMSALANSPWWYEGLNKSLPMLLISGSMDPVGNYGKGVETVFKKLRQTGVKDVSLHLYPDARHELLNEINYEEVFGDINTWLGRIRSLCR